MFNVDLPFGYGAPGHSHPAPPPVLPDHEPVALAGTSPAAIGTGEAPRARRVDETARSRIPAARDEAAPADSLRKGLAVLDVVVKVALALALAYGVYRIGKIAFPAIGRGVSKFLGKGGKSIKPAHNFFKPSHNIKLFNNDPTKLTHLGRIAAAGRQYNGTVGLNPQQIHRYTPNTGMALARQAGQALLSV